MGAGTSTTQARRAFCAPVCLRRRQGSGDMKGSCPAHEEGQCVYVFEGRQLPFCLSLLLPESE